MLEIPRWQYLPLSRSPSHIRSEFKGQATNIVGRARSRAMKAKQPPPLPPTPPLCLHSMSGPKNQTTTSELTDSAAPHWAT